jgi:urease accessory protein
VEGHRGMKLTQNQTRIPLYAAVLFVCIMSPMVAEAHLNSTGMGPIYDGLMHFLMSPEDLVPVLALALLSGLRGATFGRRILFVLPAAWLGGGLFGLAASASNGSAMVSAMWFLLLGGLLAADARLSLRVTSALAALLGLYHGYLNGAGMGLNFSSAAVLLGLIFSVFVFIALAAAFVVQLQASWTRIAVRVAGSWIFASGLLLMGWAVRGLHGLKSP